MHGECLPIAAFLILDRQDASVATRLDPVPEDATMDALLHQNFTRGRHSGDVLCLADPEGRAIYRMDSLAAAIWDLLEVPATAGEIESLLSAAFPTTDRARIAADLGDLLATPSACGLVATSPPALAPGT